MTKNRKLRATGALVLTLALATFPLALSDAVKAQTPAKTAAQTPAKTTTSPATESKGGPKEGIKVHGHWTIDVRSPDGTLVTHREFENALTGPFLITDILLRVATPGLWSIFLGGTSPETSPCAGAEGCFIRESAYPNNAPGTFKTLTLARVGDNLVLSGTATASATTAIVSVGTSLKECSNSVAPGAITSNQSCLDPINTYGFSATTLGTPVNVSAGQIVQVTVVISFS